MSSSRPFLISLLFALSFPASSRADEGHDWTQWRGPDRTGVSRDTGLLKKWPEDGPRQVWKASGIGKGFSSVSMNEEWVYTIGSRGEYEYVVGLRRTNGEE